MKKFIYLLLSLLTLTTVVSGQKIQNNTTADVDAVVTPFFDLAEEESEAARTLVTAGKILLEGTTEVFIPLHFNPNGNVNQSTFRLSGGDFAVLQFSIFDEAGNLVFEEKFKKEWSGKRNDGTEAPAGTYIYVIKARVVPSKTTKISGKVRLERD